MTEEDKKLLDRINEYAERKLNDPDKKMRVSSQLDRLKPIMLKIAEEQNTTVAEGYFGISLNQCQVLEYRRKYDPE